MTDSEKKQAPSTAAGSTLTNRSTSQSKRFRQRRQTCQSLRPSGTYDSQVRWTICVYLTRSTASRGTIIHIAAPQQGFTAVLVHMALLSYVPNAWQFWSFSRMLLIVQHRVWVIHHGSC